MSRRSSSTRLHYFHGPRQGVLGNQAGRVAPAWRNQAGEREHPRPQAASALGSKILVSSLPSDVSEQEVQELFKKTIGPLKDSFLVYNSRGSSKGMAVVEFQRSEDASTAKAKYDGRFVDGRRPIKIEIISDVVAATPPAPAAAQAPSLFQRMGGIAPAKKPLAAPPQQPRAQAAATNNHMLPRQAAAAANIQAAVPTAPRRRFKKGPKRLQKRAVERLPATIHDLDKDMEDYRAQADASDL